MKLKCFVAIRDEYSNTQDQDLTAAFLARSQDEAERLFLNRRRSQAKAMGLEPYTWKQLHRFVELPLIRG